MRGELTTLIIPDSARSWNVTSTDSPASENVCISRITEPFTGPVPEAAASAKRLALNVDIADCEPSLARRFSTTLAPCW
jgi:hypothetical protein